MNDDNNLDRIDLNGDVVDIVKPLPSIKEFKGLLPSYQNTARHKNNEGQFQWKNEMEQVTFHYVLLGDDAVIWDQQVIIEKTQNISLQRSGDPNRSFLFNYIYDANQSIQLSDDYIFNVKTLVFCSDLGSYNLILPKGFEGHILQIIISDRFLKQYIPNEYLDHPLVRGIIKDYETSPLIIKKIPTYIQGELSKIASKVRFGEGGVINKLSLLQLVAQFLTSFFKGFLGCQYKGAQIDLERDFKKKINQLFKEDIFKTFPGLEFYAHSMDMSVSTFKRAFGKHYKITPLQHFKNIQFAYAKLQLKKGEVTVTELSVRLGYPNVASFIRSYKKHVGNTPGEDFKNHTS